MVFLNSISYDNIEIAKYLKGQAFGIVVRMPRGKLIVLLEVPGFACWICFRF